VYFFRFFFLLIYVINFIFLINRRFKNVYLTFILIVVYIINNELYIMFAYVFAFYMFFFIFFNFFNTKIILICLFFAKSSFVFAHKFLDKNELLN